MKLFTGTSNTSLAKSVAEKLDIPLGSASVKQFSDGEIAVEIQEGVRGNDVFVLQSTCAPTNDNLMELLVLIDALRWASAYRITAVIPYFGYARQDRRPRSARVPMTARLAAKMVSQAGADRVVTMDLHADQIQGFFDVVTDNVYASPTMLGDIWTQDYYEQMVVSPDVGGVVRARALAKRLGDCDLAIIDKRRPRANVAEVMNVIGDVADRTCIIVDDMVDTAGTLCQAAAALKDNGALKVVAYCTHPVLSGKAVERIWASKIDELVVSNTIPLHAEAWACPTIRQLNVAEILSETIRRIHTNESVGLVCVD